MMERFGRFVARHPVGVLVVMLALTAIPGYFAVRGLTLNVILEQMLPVGHRNVQLFQRFSQYFGGANTTLVEVRTKGESIYDPEFLAKFKHLSEDIYFHPDSIRYLNQSIALKKTKKIAGGGGRVEVRAIMWPDVPKTEAQMLDFRRAVNAQYRGFLVSDDEKALVHIADFKDSADFMKLVDFIQGLREKYGGDDVTIHAVGRPLLLGIIQHSLGEVYKILAVSVVLVALVLLAYFRTWHGLVVPMVTGTIAMVWGLGAMGAVRYNLDPLLILLPAFVFAIVLSHSVQLISRVLEQIEHGHAMREAVGVSLGRLLIPSTAAIITDAAGFLVLLLVGIPSIKALALICGLWLLSIAPALVFASALLALLPPPRSHRRHSKLLEHLWENLLNLERHKVTVLMVTLALLGIGAWYSTNLKIGDAKGSAILWPDSRYNQDTLQINSDFSRLGADVMQIYIGGTERTMLDPAVYRQSEAFDRYMYETVEQTRPAQSLVPIIKLVNSVLYEGDPSYELIPESDKEVGFDLYLFRSRGEPGDFSQFTDKDWRYGNLNFFLVDHAADTITALNRSAAHFYELPGVITAKADFLCCGGQVGIVQAINDEVRRANTQIMFAIAGIIALCIFLYYRSPTVMGILLLSLATSNFLTYALMAYIGVGLNVSTLPLSALGVGLGVDYGIYMVDRVKEEFRHRQDVMGAITGAFMTSGNAIFVTAVTMILPLLPWAFMSPLRFQAEMGMMLGAVLGMNMLGALLFVPSALLLFRPRQIFTSHDDTASGGVAPVEAAA